MKKRFVLIPGSANPRGSETYRQAYELIKSEAQRRRLACHFVRYPGWGTKRNGYLGYGSAVSSALEDCRKYRPNWIVARSLGCDVATNILSSGEDWIAECCGAVLWGPTLGATINRLYPTAKDRQEEIERYEDYKAFLAPDFFEAIPPIETMVRGIQCNVRFAHGNLDSYNTRQDLQMLAEIHRRSQPDFLSEVVEIDGVEHAVTGVGLSESRLSRYLSCLFDPFAVQQAPGGQQ